MTVLFAKLAYLGLCWIDNVRIQIDDGKISTWDSSSKPLPGDELVDVLIPGIPNAHSHVFQRALAGHCECKSPSNEDDFWTWRSNMYKLAERLSPDTLKTIARQAYAEMLMTGYTSVAEFHYVHHCSTGEHSANDMFDALAEAAEDVGIHLTYLPILYERSGFGRPNLNKTQRLFALNFDAFVKHFEYATERSNSHLNVGLGVHSLRAVSQTSLERVARLARNAECPIHTHIAEQIAEVDQCVATHGTTPVRWLMDNIEVNENWCLVHATHVDEQELAKITDAAAVICLCPTTEANLGDGVFPIKDSDTLDCRIAIGSDSQISINPFEELRWLEYGHRLLHRSRNIIADKPDSHTGEKLFRDVVSGGHKACGNWRIPLTPGSSADLVTLKEDNPTLAGHCTKTIFDALVFSGTRNAIDQVMVAGDWVVQDGNHSASSTFETEYADCVRTLWN